MIEVTQRRARPARSPAAPSPRSSTFLRSLDWILLLAAARARRLRAVGRRGHHALRRSRRRALLRRAPGIAAAIGRRRARRRRDSCPSISGAAYWKLVYGATLGLMIVVFVAGGDASAARSAGSTSASSSSSRPSSGRSSSCSPSPASSSTASAPIDPLADDLHASSGSARSPILLVFMQPDLGTALVYAAALFAVLFFAGLRWRQLHRRCSPSACSRSPSVLWLLPAAGRQVLKPYQAARARRSTSRRGSRRDHLQPQPVDHGGRLRRADRARRHRARARRGSTTSPSTRPTSPSRRSPSSAGSSAARSCCSSTSSSSGAVCASITGARDLYGVVVAGGLVVAFLFQVFVNVGMTMGVAPVTGIPLPFVTVGGSSMVANLVAHRRASEHPRPR